MKTTLDLLSDITVYTRYARQLPTGRRESFEEIASRAKDMHLRKYHHLGIGFQKKIEDAWKFVYAKEVLPSMRSLQFGGKAIERNHAAIYNCSFLPVDDIAAFAEIMFLLLSGCGVGYSVQGYHVDNVPLVRGFDTGKHKFLVADTREGWADVIRHLFVCLVDGRSRPEFDWSDVRQQGTRLITSGGCAPGPEPLINAIEKIIQIVYSKRLPRKLRPIEVHDIICHLAVAVVAGDLRRSALIALFDKNDREMLDCKNEDGWLHKNSQRCMANNSAVLDKYDPNLALEKHAFLSTAINSGSGEPGFFVSANETYWGTNPCGEIALRPFQFCNLATIKYAPTLYEKCVRAKAAAFIATLQSGYTNFHYLNSKWKETTEQDALIGVSITGVPSGDNNFYPEILSVHAEEVVEVNRKTAAIMGINPAARTTCIKPEGTSSCVLGTNSGIHHWYAPYYLRSIRMSNTSSVLAYCKSVLPTWLREYSSTETLLRIPIAAPVSGGCREKFHSMITAHKGVYRNWIMSGHVYGEQTNNVSATYEMTKEDIDCGALKELSAMTETTGVTVLPASDKVYEDAPFVEISKGQYECYLSKVNLEAIDLQKVIDFGDNRNMLGELSCVGGKCDV